MKTVSAGCPFQKCKENSAPREKVYWPEPEDQICR